MALNGEYEPSKTEWVRKNVELFESTNGAEGNELNGDPIVVVTGIGAKSGKIRKNPVMRVERDGVYAVVASKGGAPENPEWFNNYVVHPEVELQDKDVKKTYRARIVEGDERQTWWDLAVATWPTYGQYQLKTNREIPVFVLEPIS